MNLIYLTIANSFLSLQSIGAKGNPEQFNFVDIVIYIILGLSLLINILFLSKRKGKSRKSSPSSGIRGGYDSWYETVEENNKKLKDEIKSLKDELTSLQNKDAPSYDETKVELTEDRSQSIVSSPIIEQEYDDEKPNVFNLLITKPETIFLPSPFEDNRFSVEDVSSEQTPSSLYQIILDDSATSGKLLIIENADFTRALNSPDHYLEKACVFENAFNPTANGIKIVESGKVKVDNQDWLILEKIKIKFI